MKVFIPIVLVFLVSCSPGGNVVTKTGLPDLSGFMEQQIHWLDSVQPGFHRVHAVNGTPDSQDPDSLDWDAELRVFKTLNLNKPGLGEKYHTNVDSTGAIKITTWYATDSAVEIRRLAVTEVNGKKELIEADLVNRGFVVDRNISLSFQPEKGYGIRVSENYIWSKPKTYEIFNQLETIRGFK